MKYKIETAPLADHYVVVAKNLETGDVAQYFTLNESGVDMLNLFCEGLDETTVSQRMADLYDMPVNIISRDVKAFAERLRSKGLLE